MSCHSPNFNWFGHSSQWCRVHSSCISNEPDLIDKNNEAKTFITCLMETAVHQMLSVNRQEENTSPRVDFFCSINSCGNKIMQTSFEEKKGTWWTNLRYEGHIPPLYFLSSDHLGLVMLGICPESEPRCCLFLSNFYIYTDLGARLECDSQCAKHFG